MIKTIDEIVKIWMKNSAFRITHQKALDGKIKGEEWDQEFNAGIDLQMAKIGLLSFKKTKDIVRPWLLINGYTGLKEIDSTCSCSLENLMFCEQPRPNCEFTRGAALRKEGWLTAFRRKIEESIGV